MTDAPLGDRPAGGDADGGSLVVLAPDGVGEVSEGADLADLLLAKLSVHDGDIVAVTSKVVAKSEGRVVTGDRSEAVPSETVRVVARRADTVIARTRHGLTLAAAGVDSSNVEPGLVVLLPADPDASARRLREAVHAHVGVNVAVLVTDTAGRPWRHGQTDIAVGAAGLRVMESFADREDGYGNRLTVTAPAVADELAGAAELAQGKLSGRPFAVLRGRENLVLPAGDHGPGARGLVRTDAEDLFGFGAREAVLRALGGAEADRPGFGAPASVEEARAAASAVLGEEAVTGPDQAGVLGLVGERGVLRALAHALGWYAAEDPEGTQLRPPPQLGPPAGGTT